MPRLYSILFFSLLPFIMDRVGPGGVKIHVTEVGVVSAFDPHDYEIKTDSPLCTIPFSRAGNLIIIKAKVDSTEGNFILDTGAPGLVLNITYFRDYPLMNTDAAQTGITETSSTAVKTNVADFSLGTFNYSSLEADVANLGHIENSRNIKILGLVGLQFFKQCEMIIDFDAGVIHLQHLSRKIVPEYANQMLSDNSTYTTVPIDIMDNRIVTTTELGGKKLKMIIDCAAETNILNSKLPNKVMEYVTISRKVKLTGSGNKQQDALYGDVSSMKVGGREIGKLPVLITNLENTCFSYNGCIDGVLGFDFLSLHKIGFNFVKRKMYIWK